MFSCLVMSDSAAPWIAGLQPSLPSPSPEVCPSSHPLLWWCLLIFWRPLLLLPSIFPNMRDFSSESAIRIRLPKYWSFNFSISPSNEYSGLISLKIDWFKISLFSKEPSGFFSSSIVWRHQFFKTAFFMVQLSQWFMWPLGKSYPLLYGHLWAE